MDVIEQLVEMGYLKKDFEKSRKAKLLLATFKDDEQQGPMEQVPCTTSEGAAILGLLSTRHGDAKAEQVAIKYEDGTKRYFRLEREV